MPRLPFCLTALVAALALSSCSLNEISKMDKEASGQADTAQRVLQSRQTLTQPTVVWSDKPWVNLQPVTPVISTPDEKNLPACQITINRPEGISLPELGQRITALCGIRVSITPDAFAALSSISTGSVVTSQMNGQLPAPDDNGRVPLSQMGTTSAQPVSVQSSPSLIRGLKYQGDIRGLLDMAASGLGLSWRIDSSGVYFYQQDTRTFQLVILNTKVNSSASINSGSGNQLGSGGGTSGGTTGDISSNQKTDYGMNSDLYDDIKKTVEQMVTPKSGRFWLSSATGTLSVTDTPDVLNRIGRYIEYQNKVLSRQVQLNIQIVSVNQTRNEQMGLDWGLVYKSLQNVGASLTGSMANASSSAASAGISILDTASGNAAKFSGSSLLIHALSEQGNVSMALNQTDPTANLTPVAYQLSKSTGMLTSSSSTATANVGVTSTMTTTNVTTGLFMTMLPFIQENGDVQLQFAFSYTSPPDIKSFVSRDGNTRNDTADTSTEGLARKVNLRSGQTLVLTGSEQQNVSADKQGTFTPGNFILGGGQTGSRGRTTLVIMITPVLLR
ncbi:MULTISPECIES: PilN family type IVB pilus formation outer membrane protein [Enterobacteriaceae]|uniref:Type IV pilus formation outer membrane protein n=1 Tax=Enterobacter cloacae subsp. cloacae (strain ATCC 13047 / DSM 30054 / NBRC 13535 / NCTC 10005 / WDCM 00083 / NCDC 279-56) TaxID=716541 RepID=A0A0H3CHE3_ENTCC|nr:MULTISPECIES: PilN family type IVB pilus formation outer membrane protein [Enterobacteriaceae]AUU88891.1 PilN family type IVB pilus formation outer membrane protein [Enterobacteriaceae bacterium ENNIH3]AUV05818.1 PilN family type IVB pilus formation outer membrane protein [Enterobacteriaceae bacterium ENNIH2]ELD7985013.1 PilN family type IVB pilus formation outer membrane protein [Enterobacter hormaechei]MDU4298385.1 PilN family type IVB pilus formation outer membrane protein [Enterobacter a